MFCWLVCASDVPVAMQKIMFKGDVAVLYHFVFS